jgi:hypothetical protein
LRHDEERDRVDAEDDGRLHAPVSTPTTRAIGECPGERWDDGRRDRGNRREHGQYGRVVRGCQDEQERGDQDRHQGRVLKVDPHPQRVDREVIAIAKALRTGIFHRPVSLRAGGERARLRQ